MDPVGEEEANIECWEDTEKEEIEACHFHFVLRRRNSCYFFKNTEKMATMLSMAENNRDCFKKKVPSVKNPSYIESKRTKVQ